MKSLVRALIQWLAMRTVAKYHPRIIGVAGSVGKTSTKEAIAAALQSIPGGIRKTAGSFNAEIGVPVTILVGGAAPKHTLEWVVVLARAIWQVCFRNVSYPKTLVIEMGADKPGDLRDLIRVAQPEIGVLTSTAPEHLEFFGDIRAVVAEESLILHLLPASGTGIINVDDERNRELLETFKMPMISYGWNESALIRAQAMSTIYDERRLPSGMMVKIAVNGSVIPLALTGSIGKHQVLPILAAMATAQATGLPLLEAVANIGAYEAPPGRMRLLPGINDTVLLDDSYNASPEAMIAALDTLMDLHVPGRKIAILGQMSELGSASQDWHKKIGLMLRPKSVSHIITVGDQAKIIGQEATTIGFPPQRHQNVPDAEAAAMFVRDLVAPGDIVLLKGSRYANRLERAVRLLLADPQRDAKKTVQG